MTSGGRSLLSYFDLADPKSLAGKVVGVPKMYIGQADSDPAARKFYTRQSVIDLWNYSRRVLEELGAMVKEVDFPLVSSFERPQPGQDGSAESIAPPHRNEVDMCQLMAYAWDDFLVDNADSKIPKLARRRGSRHGRVALQRRRWPRRC